MNNESVWKRPAWITAIVGVITALITIPDNIGNYYVKKAESNVKIAEIQATKIENKGSIQQQILQIVSEVQKQKGEERVFMLRYLAKTLSDSGAKKWAEVEVERLDRIVESKDNVVGLKEQIGRLEEKLKRTKKGEKTITDLQNKINEVNAKLAKERTIIRVNEAKTGSAGKGTKSASGVFLITLSVDGSNRESRPNEYLTRDHYYLSKNRVGNQLNLIVVEEDPMSGMIPNTSGKVICNFNGVGCDLLVADDNLQLIKINGAVLPQKVTIMQFSHYSNGAYDTYSASVACSKQGDSLECTVSSLERQMRKFSEGILGLVQD